MTGFKKISTAIFVLAFSVYAISPLVVSIPQASSLRPVDYDESTIARLMILETIADALDGNTQELGSRDDDGTDILLRKKRGITSNKIVLGINTSGAPVLAPPSDDFLFAYYSIHHAHSFSEHFFVCGISPPCLS